MHFLGMSIPVENQPELEPGMIPLSLLFRAYRREAKQPLAVAVERGDGLTTVYETAVFGTADRVELDGYYLDRLVKFLLWSRGGFRVTLCGGGELGRTVQAAYAHGGSRDFDRAFMERVYERPFEVRLWAYEDRPASREGAYALGRHLTGCRIGFDAGGSDRKVSAVIDGETVYCEEVVWQPKTAADPKYHYDGIVAALKAAAEKLPRVDAVGISSAGVYVNDRCMVASLFRAVPQERFDRECKDIYPRAVGELGTDIPLAVANDGDVTALAGAMDLGEGGVLGVAMGTSEAVGYVDGAGDLTGWLNELAFAPVDAQREAAVDEWSGDIGCGVQYFSQDGVIRLALRAGLPLQEETPAERLWEVQSYMEQGDSRAAAVYRSLGVCLGHALSLYADFYEIRHVLLLGRVMSGRGGDTLLTEARRVLSGEYPELQFQLRTPDEKSRRVGQSVAAASLPQGR